MVDFRCAIEIGQVTIHDGDIVFGDMDGVLIIPKEIATECIEKALEKAAGEKKVRAAIEIEIGKIANQRDMSKIEPSKRPLLNPSLELSGIYFMQELRRPVKQEEHKNIRELEEELIANLRKAEFLIAINAEQEEDGKLHIPYLKNKEDKIMQPVFTDVMEFEKFGRGKNLRVAKVTIDKLPNLMIPQANAYVVNPMGFNLVLNKEQIEKIAGISK